MATNIDQTIEGLREDRTALKNKLENLEKQYNAKIEECDARIKELESKKAELVSISKRKFDILSSVKAIGKNVKDEAANEVKIQEVKVEKTIENVNEIKSDNVPEEIKPEFSTKTVVDPIDEIKVDLNNIDTSNIKPEFAKEDDEPFIERQEIKL